MVSVSGPSGRRSTRRSASSGSSRSTGSSSPSRPSSARLSTTAAVTGLVIEAIRNSVSGRIGGPPTAITPAAATYPSPPRPTAATTPGASPRATAVSTISSSLSPSVISSAYDRAVTLSGSP